MDATNSIICKECSYDELKRTLMIYKGHCGEYASISNHNEILDSIFDLYPDIRESLKLMRLSNILLTIHGDFKYSLDIFGYCFDNFGFFKTYNEFKDIVIIRNNRPHIESSYFAHHNRYGSENTIKFCVTKLNEICMKLYNRKFDFVIEQYTDDEIPIYMILLVSEKIDYN